jgi:hypothetical protein
MKSNGAIEKIELVKNDFDSKTDEACKRELRSMEFIAPHFIKEGEQYYHIVEFKSRRG